MSARLLRARGGNGHSNVTKDSRGFTLVEVLVSLSCMVIAFAFLFRLHFSSSVVNSQNDLQLRALNICSQYMENQRSLGFANITAQTTVINQKPYTITITVTQSPTYYWQKTIQVTAQWNNELTGSSTHKVLNNNSVGLTSVVVSFS